MTPLGTRWVKFSAVGVLGIGVQMGCFALLASVLRANYLVATALAVETAVLHNFAWHERYTWRDRTQRDRTRRDPIPKDRMQSGTRGLVYRLLRFHAGNGAVSILGNLALMRLFVGALGMNRYLAGAGSIALCSVLNFAVSEWFVFRRE